MALPLLPHLDAPVARPSVVPDRRAAFRPSAPPPPLEKPTHLLALDIESLADPVLTPPQVLADGKFPKVLHHQVVCVSFVSARIELHPETGAERYFVEACRSGGEPGWDERRLLRAFWKFFSDGRYRVVTFNGRAFDVPVLLLRAMMYGIPVPAWFKRGDRWNGYGQRYSAEWHADLLELLSTYGASTRLGLDEVATAMGFPGKAGESGAKVADMMAAGEVGRVRDYCETDCLNTILTYYRHSLLAGRTDVAGHDASVTALVRYLEAERDARPHLGAFLDLWRRSDRPSPMTVG